VEYLHNSTERPKTLFATHYHELNDLEKLYPRVHNWHISVKEMNGKIIFLRKLCKGGVSHSFGIHVARLAGMPSSVIHGAEVKLKALESAQKRAQEISKEEKQVKAPIQLSLFQLDDPLLLDIKEELKTIDINTMSPLDAFDKLRGLRKKIGL